ncbi:hypothetical protein ACROYT_G008021 [Oculina patagonica]
MLLYRCKACLLAIVQFAAISGTLASTKSAPYFIEEPSDTYVKKGKPAELKCQVGGNPKPSVMWKRDGNKLDLTGDSRRMIKPDGSLYFSEVIHNKTQKPDEGTYQCEAFSQISNLDYQIASRTARLIVAGISSKVAVVPSKLKVPYGDTSRFFCSLKHSAPKAVISWRKKGENDTIKAGDRFTLIPNGALQIRNIRFEEQGQYECIAENTFIARKHTSTVAGLFEVIPDNGFPRRPRFAVTPEDTVAIAGSKVVLECVANGFPKPRVTWLRDGSPVVLGSDYSVLGESNLMIKSVSVAHAGNYTCQAKSGQRKEEATAKLEVHYAPVFTKKPRTVHAYQYTNVRFDCLADGIPKPRITWSKTGDVIGNTAFTTVGNGYLLILDVVFSDMGSYQCFAENSFGKIQATVELSVYRKGDPLPVTEPPPTTTAEPTTTVTTTRQSTTPKARVPEKPENVVAQARSDTEIELTWAPPTVPNGEILEYKIFFKYITDGPIGFESVNTSGDNLRILLSDLKPDTRYVFNVYAVNKQGAGAISDEATAMTLSSSQVPGRPRNLVAEAETDSTIRVTWAEPDTGPSSVFRYVIVYKDASSSSGEMQDITKQQTRLLRNLKTYTKYIINVYAENKRGAKGASAVTEATTKGGVPRVPPTDLVLKPDSSGRGLIATWKAPDPTKVNGRITFYIIKFRKVGSQVENTTGIIGADKQSYSIKGLMPSTRYEAKIAAGTDSGLGEYTKDWVDASTNVTKCKEDTTPGKPTFVLLKKFPNAILVGWQPPDNAGLVCVTGYRISWGENSPYQFSIGPLSSDKTQYLIKGLGPNKTYVILLRAINSKGNGLDIQAQVQTSVRIDPVPVKDVQAIPTSPKVMRLSWRDTQVPNTPVIYHVYHSLRKKLSYCGNTTEKTIRCFHLKPYTKYTFYVRRNDEGINATVSNFTEEDKPGPPMDLTGNPDEVDFTRLSLHWQPPLELNGHILKYRIYYSTNVNASLKTWKVVEAEGSKLTKQISSLTPGTIYYFQMQAKTKKGWGPLAIIKKPVATLTDVPMTTDAAAATALTLTPVPSDPDPAAAQGGAGGLKNKTLWIVIAAVAGITLIAIIIISVILCKKRSGDDIQRKPPTYKSVIHANGSAKKKNKEEKPPDLWINHTENLEMKPIEAVNPAPDVTNTSTIPRSTVDMKPLEDSPLDHIKVDNERSSFLNGSEADPEDFADLPPPPMIDSKGDPYPEYADEDPTPPPSPGVSPFLPPRVVTPEDVKPPMYPKTSTPRYQMHLPRTGSCENTLDVADPRPPQRSRSYDPDFRAPSSKVPVYPMLHTSPPATLPKPRPKPPVAPADDIQLPPVGYNRKTPPNGYWTPPPKYEDIFARRSNPPSSPPREQDAVTIKSNMSDKKAKNKECSRMTVG